MHIFFILYNEHMNEKDQLKQDKTFAWASLGLMIASLIFGIVLAVVLVGTLFSGLLTLSAVSSITAKVLLSLLDVAINIVVLVLSVLLSKRYANQRVILITGPSLLLGGQILSIIPLIGWLFSMVSFAGWIITIVALSLVLKEIKSKQV